ncbi:MAG TPA: threonine/serine exporter family protein, partial [Usitatibacter sp.]|nr:threonine/serine exporter family protein [Usitatibacter sp.]
MTNPPASPRPDGVAAERLVLRLARALHESGAPAHRLEDVMVLLAPRLGIEGQFFSTPTSIFASFGPEGAQRTALVRVEPGGVNLERLGLLDAVIEEVSGSPAGIAAAEARVEAIVRSSDRYPVAATVGCFALASATAARFFGGGPREILVAAAIGLTTGLLAAGAARHRALARVFEPLASVMASLLALGLGTVLGAYSLPLASLSGLIVLLPGLSLTLAMTEIATRHW